MLLSNPNSDELVKCLAIVQSPSRVSVYLPRDIVPFDVEVHQSFTRERLSHPIKPPANPIACLSERERQDALLVKGVRTVFSALYFGHFSQNLFWPAQKERSRDSHISRRY